MLRAVIQQTDSTLSPIKKLPSSVFLDTNPLHDDLVEIESKLLKLIENKSIANDIKVKMYHNKFNSGLKIKISRDKKNKKSTTPIIEVDKNNKKSTTPIIEVEKKIQKKNNKNSLEKNLLQNIENMFKEQNNSVVKLLTPTTGRFISPVSARTRGRSRIKKLNLLGRGYDPYKQGI